MINYFITLVFVYLGLIVGYVISGFSKEELEPGKKYFLFLKSVLFALVLFIFFIHIKLSLYVAVPLLIAILAGTYLWVKKYNTNYNEIFFSCLMGITFGEIFSPLASLIIFCFFVVSSSLDYKEGLFAILKKRVLFLIIGLILILF
jgi:hypothetical protein